MDNYILLDIHKECYVFS